MKEMTIDGNTGAAYVAYAFTQIAAIYPITPSSTMAELTESWSVQGKENLFGQPVRVVQMQSEAGAAGAMHGALQSGALATTFTASQGLLLMIPNMYKMAGELLPGVFHVSARALSAQALNIFGDHQDVMATRQTGCVILCACSVQEVVDLALVAHLSAITGELPVVHFFDGFRTSHEIQKVQVPDYEEYEKIFDEQSVYQFQEKVLSPNHPVTKGTAQNSDIYFQTREVSEKYYRQMIFTVMENMKLQESITHRSYHLFDYYGSSQAKYVIVAMGSVCETIQEVIDELQLKGNQDCGLIQVRLYRPFSREHFLECIPEGIEAMAVLDRTKEPGALGEPLYLDVVECMYQSGKKIRLAAGRYGLGSKNTTPEHIMAVYENLWQRKEEYKEHFTIGIVDDVMHTSLERKEKDVFFCKQIQKDRVQCKFYGMGSDGTVGANKQAVKLIGNYTDKKVQAYFAYDSKKSGGLTISHLRFGDSNIKSAYYVQEADYIACHMPSYLYRYDMISDLKPGGCFVLNCVWDKETVVKKLPKYYKEQLIKQKAEFYVIHGHSIARELGLGNHISMVMQGAFFKCAKVIEEEKAKELLDLEIEKTFGKKGESIVEKNKKALRAGFEQLQKIELTELEKSLNMNRKSDETKEEIEITKSGKDALEQLQRMGKKQEGFQEFIENIMIPMGENKGDMLPVSAFLGREDGHFPNGTAALEKRGVASEVPRWIPKNCIQCNRCAFICPHSCIRPYLLDGPELEMAPEDFATIPAIGEGVSDYKFRIQVSPLDCTGCGNCADICPAKEKALVMEDMQQHRDVETENHLFAEYEISKKLEIQHNPNVKTSQFAKPLVEFSGACAGCGETPYIKLVTQLFGKRMIIANATGCSSIWGASAPSTPYTCNEEGKGPAFGSSLFEDNAEYGYGMYLGVQQMREQLQLKIEEYLSLWNQQERSGGELQRLLAAWLEKKEDKNQAGNIGDHMIEMLGVYHPVYTWEEKCLQEIQNLKDYFVKPSIWLVGGDGWAYDIGFGGVDQVVSTGADVNILVFDTEVYSNTGGQMSKSTPTAAVAKFASKGKDTRKKDLGRMLMTYENVYIAQIAMGADMNHTLQAIKEAESFEGPSVLIAYAPCINHGIKEGMGRSIENMRQAVESGYFHLYRFDPRREAKGENVFSLDSKVPSKEYIDYIKGQLRYTYLEKAAPKEAEKMYQHAKEDAHRRYEIYQQMSGQQV